MTSNPSVTSLSPSLSLSRAHARSLFLKHHVTFCATKHTPLADGLARRQKHQRPLSISLSHTHTHALSFSHARCSLAHVKAHSPTSSEAPKTPVTSPSHTRTSALSLAHTPGILLQKRIANTHSSPRGYGVATVSRLSRFLIHQLLSCAIKHAQLAEGLAWKSKTTMTFPSRYLSFSLSHTHTHARALAHTPGALLRK